MTCIVGLEHNKNVFIGGDSAAVLNGILDIRADNKVFTRNNFIFGFTDSFRMGQLLQYGGVKIPSVSKYDKHIDKFMTTVFIDWVRETLSDGGWLLQESSRDSAGEFLVGTLGGFLYRIDSDLQIARPQSGYFACGSGEAVALGSLYSTQNLEPRERVQLALEAAAHHTTYVRAPFVIEKA